MFRGIRQKSDRFYDGDFGGVSSGCWLRVNIKSLDHGQSKPPEGGFNPFEGSSVNNTMPPVMHGASTEQSESSQHGMLISEPLISTEFAQSLDPVFA